MAAPQPAMVWRSVVAPITPAAARHVGVEQIPQPADPPPVVSKIPEMIKDEFTDIFDMTYKFLMSPNTAIVTI